MFGFWKKRAVSQETADVCVAQSITVTLPQVKQAIRNFEDKLPKGINRTVLIGSNNEINFELLIPQLQGLPDQKFYMSRETFEIFAEEDYLIPLWLDIVQRAVDDYIAEAKSPPTVPGDRRRKINYMILEQNYYLKERPPLDFYLTKMEDLISHVPENR